MSSLVRLLITSNGTKADFQSQANMAMGGLDAVNSVVDYLAGLSGGQRIGAKLDWGVGAIQAYGVLTVSAGGSSNGNTGTILNSTFTAKTSGADPTMGEFNISATAATQAASMVIAINTVLGSKVLATAALGVVTITALVPGVIGNGLQLSAGNLANTAATAFAHGDDGTAYSQDLR